MKPLIAATVIASAIVVSGPAKSAQCEQMVVGKNQYIVCSANIKTDKIELFLKDQDEQILGSFHAVQKLLKKDRRGLVFAFNAGMYHPDRQPVGLFVSKGKKTASVKIGYGSGNFSLRPNGVFYIENARAAVEETSAFITNRRKPQLATQSGPMLVINNKLHPKFQPDSHSRKIRNGIGVRKDGKTVIFALSQTRVNFHTFASFFRDQLKTPNALYLDGTISQIYSPQVRRTDTGDHMGPIIAVTKPLP